MWRATDAHANPASKQWHSSRQPVEGWRRTPQADATALLGLIAFSRSSVFLAPLVFALELFDATSSIYELLLASVEGMRCRTDIDHHQRIGLAIDFTGAIRLDRGASDKLNARGGVLENNLVVIGMNAVFHDPRAWKNKESEERGPEIGLVENRITSGRSIPAAPCGGLRILSRSPPDCKPPCIFRFPLPAQQLRQARFTEVARAAVKAGNLQKAIPI